MNWHDKVQDVGHPRSSQHGSFFSTERGFVTHCSSYFWARKSPCSWSSFHNSHFSLLIVTFITFWSIWILIQSMFIYPFLSPRKCSYVDDLRLSFLFSMSLLLDTEHHCSCLPCRLWQHSFVTNSTSVQVKCKMLSKQTFLTEGLPNIFRA